MISKKNRVVLGVALPVLAATTLIGAGFATWYLGDVETTENGSLEAEVAPAINGTTFAVASGKIYLDQGGYENLENKEVGISYETGSYVLFGYATADVIEDAPEITYTETVTGSLDDWITPANITAPTVSTVDVTTGDTTEHLYYVLLSNTVDEVSLQDALKASEDDTINTLTVADNAIVSYTEFPELSYTQKPANINEYNSLVAALEGSSVDFSGTFKVD